MNTVHILDSAKEYILSLKYSEQGIIKLQLEIMESGQVEYLSTKQLRGKIRELIVGNHRLIYFQITTNIYFVIGFRKKSRKTPKNLIDKAEKIYKSIKS